MRGAGKDAGFVLNASRPCSVVGNRPLSSSYKSSATAIFALISVLATAEDNREFLQDCPHDIPEGHPFLGAITYGSDMSVPGAGLFFGSEDFALLYEEELTYGAESKEDILERSQALSQVPPLEWAEDDSLTEEERRLAKVYPVYWIDPSDPPFLAMWGEKDADPDWPNWSTREATSFVKLLEGVGVPATYVLVPGALHSWLGSDSLAWQEPMERFLDVLLE